MLIYDQDRESFIMLDQMKQCFIKKNNPKEVPPAFCVTAEAGNDWWVELGQYSTHERAKEVLKEIVEEYAKYKYTDGGPLATVEYFIQPFGYTEPKVYCMPEE